MRGTSEGVTEYSWRYEGWRVASASMLALMVGPSTVALSFGVFVRPIAVDFGWTLAQVTLVSSILAFSVIPLSPLQGYFADKYGARPVILVSIPIFGLAVGAIWFLPANLWLYYLAYLAVAVTGIGQYPLSYLRAVSTWFSKRLGLALGIANAGIGLGTAVLPLILGLTIPAFGWRAGYVLIALLVFGITFPAALFVREKPRDASPNDEQVTGAEGLALSEAIRTAEFQLLVLAFVLMGFVTTALIIHQIPILTRAGFSSQQAAIVQSTFGLSLIVSRLMIGWLLDWVSAYLLMIIAVLGSMVTCLLYAVPIEGNFVFVCSALIGLLVGAEFDVAAYLLKTQFGVRSFGKLYGIVYGVFNLSAGIGVMVLSFMMQASGGYRSGLLLFAAVLLLCIGTLVIMHRRTSKAASLRLYPEAQPSAER